MKAAWGIVAGLFTVLFLLQAASYVIADYQYERDIASYWNLADKASTLEQKAAYIDQFVAKLESNSKLAGSYDALWMKTPDNSFDANLAALKSLQSRLHEVQTMDVQSFAYQTAIQQITAQEQGEAKQMLSTFHGVWTKENWFTVWDWPGICLTLLFGLLMFVFWTACIETLF